MSIEQNEHIILCTLTRDRVCGAVCKVLNECMYVAGSSGKGFLSVTSAVCTFHSYGCCRLYFASTAVQRKMLKLKHIQNSPSVCVLAELVCDDTHLDLVFPTSRVSSCSCIMCHVENATGRTSRCVKLAFRDFASRNRPNISQKQ